MPQQTYQGTHLNLYTCHYNRHINLPLFSILRIDTSRWSLMAKIVLRFNCFLFRLFWHMCWIKLMITVIYSIITCSETLCVNWYVLFHWVRARVDEGSSLENPTIYNKLLHMPLLKQTWDRNMECVLTKHVISCCVFQKLYCSGNVIRLRRQKKIRLWLSFLECQHGWIQKNYKCVNMKLFWFFYDIDASHFT